MLMQNAAGVFLCWSRAVRSGVNQGLYLFLVQLNVACLFNMVRKALLKNKQASSTDGMRSISFQDTQARSIKKACLLNEVFKGAFDSDEGWSFDRRPITDAGNEAVIAEFLVENSRGVFGGQVG